MAHYNRRDNLPTLHLVMAGTRAGVVKESEYMAKELRVERERSKLNINQLTQLLDGGEIVTERRRKMGK